MNFLGIKGLENILRVQVSDETLVEIEKVQKKIKEDFPDYDAEVTREYKDYDSMKETVLWLHIRKNNWNIGYYDYDGFWALEKGYDTMIGYCYLGDKHHYERINQRWKSDVINFLTGKERIEIIQKYLRMG